LPFVVVPAQFVESVEKSRRSLFEMGFEVDDVGVPFIGSRRLVVRSSDGRYLLVEKRENAAIIYVYDSLQMLYDVHVLLQVVGRLYPRSFKSLHVRYDYWSMLKIVRLFEPRRGGKRVGSLKDAFSDLEKALARVRNVTEFVYGLYGCDGCGDSMEFVDEFGNMTVARVPEDILGRGEYKFDLDKYYASRMNEFKNLGRRLRRRMDVELVAKFIVYEYRIRNAAERVVEFVRNLPAEIVEKVEMFFPAVRLILRELFPPRRICW